MTASLMVGPAKTLGPTTQVRDRLVQAIMRDAGAAGVPCDAEAAGALIDALARAASLFSMPGTQYIFSADEMAAMHEVLDVVVPDYAVATPGSAHDMLNRELLGQGAFCHGRIGKDDPQYHAAVLGDEVRAACGDSYCTLCYVEQAA